MPDWVVAEDVGGRVRQLRTLLGEGQGQFAKRFRRSWKRVSAWENGATPPHRVLEEACAEQGWPREIFEQGGRYPTDLIPAPTRPAETRTVRERASGAYPERRAPPDPEETRRQRAIVPAVTGQVNETTGRLVEMMRDGQVPPEAGRIILADLQRIAELVSQRGGSPPPRTPGDS